VYYPWKDTPPNGGFFVPTLRLAEVKEDGLRAANHHRIKAKAEIGVKDGKIGVYFSRVSR